MRRVPLERPLDRRRNWRRYRQMRPARHEAVLVRDVLQLDGGAIGRGVVERALRLLDGVLRAGVLQHALLLGRDAVLRLVAPLVRAVEVHLLLLLQDADLLAGRDGRLRPVLRQTAPEDSQKDQLIQFGLECCGAKSVSSTYRC